MLEEAGFVEVEVEPVPIVRHYENVLDWLGETRDLSRQLAIAWGTMVDEQRRELRERIAAAASEFSDGSGGLVLPGSSLGAAASA
jgi:hypothetical protein